MDLPHFTAKDPAIPPSPRWWLSLYPRLSAATKRSLLLLSLSAALLVNGQRHIASREGLAPPNSPFVLPAVQHALHQLNLPSRDPIGDQFQVNTYTTFDQLWPAMALDSDGDFVVVWWSQGGSGSDTDGDSIQGQRYNSVGVSQGSQFQVNTYTTGNQRFPAVSLDSDGDFVVVWDSDGSSGSDTSFYSIQGQRYNSVGVSQGSQFQVNTYTTNSQRFPAVSLDDSGDFVVVWHSNGSSGGDTSLKSIQGQRYNSVGTAQGGQFQVNTYTTNDQEYSAVSLDSDGDFVVVWDSAGSGSSDTDGDSIQGRRYNSAGTAQGSQFQVNTYTTNDQEYPTIALDGNGDFVVVWDSTGSSSSDTDGQSIQGQRYNSAGTAQGNQFQVNSYTTGGQTVPNVSLDSDGDFVVIWQSYGSSGGDTSSLSIQGQLYNSSGTAQGNQFQVNTYTTNQQRYSAVSLDSDGDFVVVWQSGGSSNGDTSGDSIQGQRFSAVGPTPTPTVTPSATPSNTPTPTSPAAPPTRAVHLPAIISEEFPYFDEPCEDEPNDTVAQANGYLRSGQSYCGYPNDYKDFFSFYLFTAGTIMADLTNHTGEGVQLQLFYQSTNNLVDFDTGLSPLHVEYNGPAGLYYIYIFTLSGYNNTIPYSLVVSHS